MKKLRNLGKQLRFAYLVSRPALRRLISNFTHQPFRQWIRGLLAFLAGYVHTEDLPGRVQNQALIICLLEGRKFHYTWFRWQGLNRLCMYYGREYTYYDFFIIENELD